MYLVLTEIRGSVCTSNGEWSLCTLYIRKCQVRVTVGDSGLCCGVRVTSVGC